jgi:HTH-type transcriptional regulator / antitoxin HigA
MIRAINDKADLDAALARFDELWSERQGDPGWEERNWLSDLISKYEDRNHEIPPPDPIEAIRFRMEQAGLHQKDLIPYIGAASRVSEVLHGKRKLTPDMIRGLHEGLSIPLASLLGVAPEQHTPETPSGQAPHLEPCGEVSGALFNATDLEMIRKEVLASVFGELSTYTQGTTAPKTLVVLLLHALEKAA